MKRLGMQPSLTDMICVQILVTTRYHRIYVTSEDRRPCGIITLTDILQLIAGRHLSLPKGSGTPIAGVQPATTPARRRSMSQPEGMQGLEKQACQSPSPLRAVQTAPELELSTPQGSTTSDYLGQLLEMDMLGQLPAAGSDTESILQALRTMSPAPAGAQPTSSAQPQTSSAPPVPSAPQGSSGPILESAVDPKANSISMSTAQPIPDPIRSLAEPAAQPLQQMDDAMDVGELMTFDEDSMLLPLPREAHPKISPSRRVNPPARPPLRTESSPCSMADAFPSFPDLASLPEQPLPRDPAPPDRAPRPENATAGGMQSSGSQGVAGSSISRPSSPWQAPWYFGRSCSPAGAFLDTPLESSELEGYLEAGRFLSDSPAPSNPPSRPSSRAWQMGPAATSAAPSDIIMAGGSLADGRSSSPAVPAAAAAGSKKMRAINAAAIPDCQGPDEQEELSLLPATPVQGSRHREPSTGIRSRLSAAARSGSLPRIGDLQLGSPQGSSGDLQSMPFGSSPPGSSQNLSVFIPSWAPEESTGAVDMGMPGPDSPDIMTSPARGGESPPGGQDVMRGKARPLRQQHTFPHEAPTLTGSSRKKWCKVSSSSNLDGWERSP